MEWKCLALGGTLAQRAPLFITSGVWKLKSLVVKFADKDYQKSSNTAILKKIS